MAANDFLEKLDAEIKKYWNYRSGVGYMFTPEGFRLWSRDNYNRLDALILLRSNIFGGSFVENCKELGINYDELQKMFYGDDD